MTDDYNKYTFRRLEREFFLLIYSYPHPFIQYNTTRRNNTIEQRQGVEGCLIYRLECDEERRIKKKAHYIIKKKEKKEHMMGQSTLNVRQYNKIKD